MVRMVSKAAWVGAAHCGSAIIAARAASAAVFVPKRAKTQALASTTITLKHRVDGPFRLESVITVLADEGYWI
jgi:hypothetical protein